VCIKEYRRRIVDKDFDDRNTRFIKQFGSMQNIKGALKVLNKRIAFKILSI